MTEKEIAKEVLKKIVDDSNYNDKVKNDVKLIVDISNTPEEIFERTLAYFAGLHMND